MGRQTPLDGHHPGPPRFMQVGQRIVDPVFVDAEHGFDRDNLAPTVAGAPERDPENYDADAFTWSVASRPVGSNATVQYTLTPYDDCDRYDHGQHSTAEFEPDVAGTYVLELDAPDGSHEVTIHVFDSDGQVTAAANGIGASGPTDSGGPPRIELDGWYDRATETFVVESNPELASDSYAVDAEMDVAFRPHDASSLDASDIAVEGKKKKNEAPYSMDANLLHISYEGGELEDPWYEPEADMWKRTVDPELAPDQPQYVEITFKKGDPVAFDGKKLSPAKILRKMNEVAGTHGVGRDDLVENRYVGMKSRGCYETPGGTLLLKARRAMESITLDRELAHLKDDLMPRYATLVYNGYWWSPERRSLQKLIDDTQERVNGVVRLKLFKGGMMVVGRKSETDSLYDQSISTFEDDRGTYDQKDAEGFIKLNALRLRLFNKDK